MCLARFLLLVTATKRRRNLQLAAWVLLSAEASAWSLAVARYQAMLVPACENRVGFFIFY